MAQITTTVLEELKSGQIVFVQNGVFASIQFRCDCLDAIHLCHGMCCTRRAGFSVELEEDELPNYFHNEKGILASTPDGMACFYLREGKCGIYERRPRMCRQWHCSPDGQKDDDQIVRRDAGWILIPVRKEEADFVQSIVRRVE
jgi:hypothetical protein